MQMKRNLSILLLYAQDFREQTNGPFGGPVNSIAVNSSGHLFAVTSGNGHWQSAYLHWDIALTAPAEMFRLQLMCKP